MSKKTEHSESKLKKPVVSNDKARIAVLVLFTLISIGAIGVSVWSIVASMNDQKPGQQYGVGADGFRAFVDDKATLNVDKIVKKDQVVAVLKGLAKSVGDPNIEKVFNLNGNLGQTITYPFVRTDGVKSSLYIDKRQYKDKKAFDSDRVYDETMKSGAAKEHPIYLRVAQTIGGDREYSLMVVNGLTVYRFVIAQPFDNISITEVTAAVALKKLAQQATY